MLTYQNEISADEVRVRLLLDLLKTLASPGSFFDHLRCLRRRDNKADGFAWWSVVVCFLSRRVFFFRGGREQISTKLGTRK